jgi:MFS family permease
VTAAAPLRLTRDTLTWSVYASLAGWTWFLYGFAAALPLLRTEQGASRTVMGLHSTMLAVGAVLAGLTTHALVRRLTRRRMALAALLAIAVGTGLLTAVRPVPATLAVALLLGIGGSTILNVLNPALLDQQGPAGPAALSEGNAVASAVGLFAPLAVGGGVALGLTWRPGLLLACMSLVPAIVLLHRIVPGTTAVDDRPASAAGRPPALPVVFWPLGLAVGVLVSVEFCVTTWSADLLMQRTPLGPGAASAGVSAVIAAMAVGRFATGHLALRVPLRGLLLGGIGLTVLGWVVTWLSTAATPALLGLAITGLGLSGHFPLASSLALLATPGQRDQAAGRLSLVVGAAIGVAPLTLGAMADVMGTHRAFVLVPVLLGTAAALLLGGARPARGLRPRRPSAAG